MVNTKVIDTINEIQMICDFKILSKTRKRNYIDARAALYCVLNKRYRLTDQLISEELAKLGFHTDRSNIWHHLNKYDTYYKFSPLFKEIIQIMKGEKVKLGNEFRNRTDLEVFLAGVEPKYHNRIFEEVKDTIFKLHGKYIR